MKRTDLYYQELTSGLDAWCYHSDPPLSSVPHLIFPCKKEILGRILSVTGRKGMPYYSDCLETGIVQDEFCASVLQKWKTSEYQKKLIGDAWEAIGDDFLVLDAWTPKEKLQRLSNILEKQNSDELLLAELNELHWFFRSASQEISAAVFVVRSANKYWIETVQEKFENLGIKYTRFIRQNGHDVLMYDH